MVYDQKLIVFALQGYAAFAVIQSRPHEIWARFFGSTIEDRPVYTPDDCLANFPFPDRYSSLEQLTQIGQAYYQARADIMKSNNEGLTKLYNRFTDPENQDPAIINLRKLHAAMDRAVLDAYNWTDLDPAAIHEREWDAEDGDRPGPWRLRWPEDDRDEVLARLLELNRQRKEEEAQETQEPPRQRGRSRSRGLQAPGLLV